MPLYDFECKCGNSRELFCNWRDADKQECSVCHNMMVKKVSAATIVSGIRGLHQMTDDGFKTVLKAIKNGAPKSKGEELFQNSKSL